MSRAARAIRPGAPPAPRSRRPARPPRARRGRRRVPPRPSGPSSRPTPFVLLRFPRRGWARRCHVRRRGRHVQLAALALLTLGPGSLPRCPAAGTPARWGRRGRGRLLLGRRRLSRHQSAQQPSAASSVPPILGAVATLGSGVLLDLAVAAALGLVGGRFLGSRFLGSRFLGHGLRRGAGAPGGHMWSWCDLAHDQLLL